MEKKIIACVVCMSHKERTTFIYLLLRERETDSVCPVTKTAVSQHADLRA